MAGFPQLDPDFSPAQLSPHLWLDPSDLTTLFQERTGASATTPAEVDGVVGTMLDKSGNGHHVVAPSDAARPILRNSGSLYWLESDGTDDTLSDTFAEIDRPVDRVSAWRILTFADGARMMGVPAAHQCMTRTQLRLYGEIDSGLTTPADDLDFVLTDRCNGADSRAALDNGAYAEFDASSSIDAITGVTLFSFDGTLAAGSFFFYGLVQRDSTFTDPEIVNLRTYLAFKQGRTSLAPRPLRAIDTQGGSGRSPQPKALPYWWQSYLAQWLAELEEREAEYQRIKAEQDAKAAAERYRQALATIAARRAEEQRQAAEAAALRREQDAKLAQRLAAIRSEKDERLAQEQARIEAAKQRVKDKQEAARQAAEAAELAALRTTARNRGRRFKDRFEAAIEAARRQGWRAKLN